MTSDKLCSLRLNFAVFQGSGGGCPAGVTHGHPVWQWWFAQRPWPPVGAEGLRVPSSHPWALPSFWLLDSFPCSRVACGFTQWKDMLACGLLPQPIVGYVINLAMGRTPGCQVGPATPSRAEQDRPGPQRLRDVRPLWLTSTWLGVYGFRAAGSRSSPRSSGRPCLVYTMCPTPQLPILPCAHRR